MQDPKIIQELFTSFIGNIAQDLVMNGAPNEQVISDYAKQFSQAITKELQKDNSISLADNQRDNLEAQIELKMNPIVENIFNALDKSKDKIYREYQINPSVSLADAAVVMQEKLQVNLIAKMVEHSELQKEKSGFKKFIEKILEILHLKETGSQKKLQNVVESGEKIFQDIVRKNQGENSRAR